MKKFIPVLIAIIFVFSLCACSNGTAEEVTTEAEAHSHEHIHTETTLETVTGTLYAVIDGKTATNQFSCSGGTITPERIAAGFTSWTGINFGLTSEIDESAKTMTLSFKDTSAMSTKSLTANEAFVFDSFSELKTFMLNSLKETIKQNIGEYEITFTVNGEEIN